MSHFKVKLYTIIYNSNIYRKKLINLIVTYNLSVKYNI